MHIKNNQYLVVSTYSKFRYTSILSYFDIKSTDCEYHRQQYQYRFENGIDRFDKVNLWLIKFR